MGDPTYFSIRAGANPHTRTAWGTTENRRPYQSDCPMACLCATVVSLGVRVLVVPPDPAVDGLVYPANAGFLFPLDATIPSKIRHSYLANLLPTRAGEQPIYDSSSLVVDFGPTPASSRFEGEADFFPVGDRYLFTYGRVEAQRFRFRLGLPPYERVYGFRSEIGALDGTATDCGRQRSRAARTLRRSVLSRRHRLCAFGPERRFLLAYLEALMPQAVERLQALLKDDLIPLRAEDAALYAANSFTLTRDGDHSLFMPAGVSERLYKRKFANVRLNRSRLMSPSFCAKEVER